MFVKKFLKANSITRIVRLFILFYLIGIVTAAQIFFFLESFLPLPITDFAKSITITILIPLVSIVVGMYVDERFKKENRSFIPYQESQESLKWYERYDWLIYGLVMFGVWSGLYFWIAESRINAEKYSMMVEFDKMIPFIPEWVWIYLTVYMIFLIPLFGLTDRRLLKIVMSSYITVMLICYIFFYLYPVEYPRPNIVVNDFSTWALSLVYKNDRPWNCFPSSHCAMAMMAALVLLEINWFFGIWGMITALSIGASTLFTKQHFILDVIAGFGLSILVYYVYFKSRLILLLGKKQKEFSDKVSLAVDRLVESRFEDLIRRIVREEIEKVLSEKEDPQK
ncbi:MAG: phosphatase PAP2 family protein [Deltaproteobacteria bacterium]|nr:phosphatase PAP2 family protein [Deltaproteobacteria bacterium]